MLADLSPRWDAAPRIPTGKNPSLDSGEGKGVCGRQPGVHLLGSAGLHASLLDIGLFLCRLGARTLPGYLLLDGQGLEGRADCTACCPTWGRGALPALLALCLTLPRVGLASGVMNPGLTASIHSEYPGAVLHLK